MYIDESLVKEQRKSLLPQPSAEPLHFNITWWQFTCLKTALPEWEMSSDDTISIAV